MLVAVPYMSAGFHGGIHGTCSFKVRLARYGSFARFAEDIKGAQEGGKLANMAVLSEFIERRFEWYGGQRSVVWSGGDCRRYPPR